MIEIKIFQALFHFLHAKNAPFKTYFCKTSHGRCRVTKPTSRSIQILSRHLLESIATGPPIKSSTVLI